MEVMDQMIYEIYRKMQDYFKASVKAVLETGRDYDDFDDFDEESELCLPMPYKMIHMNMPYISISYHLHL